MAKEKVLKLSGDRQLGAVTKKLSSGMFETSKGEKVPPLPGITIGTKVKLEKSRFVIVTGGKETVNSTEDADKSGMDALKKENAALKKRMDAMEKAQGEKGSKVNPLTSSVTSEAKNVATPPKVEA